MEAVNSTSTSRYAVLVGPFNLDGLRSEGSCSPSVFIQETFLHQAVYIYLLKATDIRPADRSLFDKKDILVIHTVPCVFVIASQKCL